MRTNFLAMSLFVTALAAPDAWAGQVGGIYVGGALGPNFLQQGSSNVTGPAAPFVVDAGKARFDLGARLSVSAGYGFGNGLRLEIEGTLLGNSTDSKRPTSAGSRRNNGYDTAAGGFFNVIYDVDLETLGLGRAPLGITPYVGVGLGALSVRRQNVVAAGLAGLPADTRERRAAAAGQILLGAAVPITDSLSATIDLRAAGRPEQKDETLTVVSGSTQRTLKVSAPAVAEQSILVGLRYTFGQ